MRLWLFIGLFGAGAVHAVDMSAPPKSMIALRYIDQDSGDPAYLTRILVTPGFMRMDGGEDDGDFILLDRQQRKVFNIMRGNMMAMVFSAGVLPPKPSSWTSLLDVRKGARGTQRYRLTVNGVVCSEGVVARRAAPDAARAMAELKSVLAVTQYRVWQESPSEVRHDCDLANQVWESGTTLALGLLLEEREFSGRFRRFESESKQPLRPELFYVPEGLAVVNAPS